MENGEEQTCRICGVWFPKSQLINGCCMSCFDLEQESLPDHAERAEYDSDFLDEELKQDLTQEDGEC